MFSVAGHPQHAPCLSKNSHTANVRRLLQDVRNIGLHDDATEDQLEVDSTELDQLDDATLRDAHTLKFCDVINTFLGSWVRHSRSDPQPLLALPKGVLAPNPVAPDAEFAARDIAQHMCRQVAAEEGAVCGSGSVPVVCVNGHRGRPTSWVI